MNHFLNPRRPKRPILTKADVEQNYADLVKTVQEAAEQEKAVAEITDANDGWIRDQGENIEASVAAAQEAIRTTHALKDRLEKANPLFRIQPSEWNEILQNDSATAATKDCITQICTWLHGLTKTEFGDHVKDTLRNLFDMDLRSMNQEQRQDNDPTLTNLTHITQTQFHIADAAKDTAEQHAVRLRGLQEEISALKDTIREKDKISNGFKVYGKGREDKLQEARKERDNLKTQHNDTTAQLTALQELVGQKDRQIDILREKVEQLKDNSAQLSTQQYESFENTTTVALRLFIADLQDTEDEVIDFPPDLVCALNRYVTQNTGFDTVSYWTVLTTSDEPHEGALLAGEVDFMREMFRLFAMLNRPAGSYHQPSLNQTLQRLTHAVATNSSIACHVAEIVCGYAHSKLACIQDTMPDDYHMQVAALQLCQMLDIIACRWQGMNIPSENVLRFRARHDIFGHLSKAMQHQDIRQVCLDHPASSQWLLCQNCALTTDPTWQHIAYVDLESRTIYVVNKSDAEDGHNLTAILRLSEEKSVEVNLGSVEGRIWWLTNVA